MRARRVEYTRRSMRDEIARTRGSKVICLEHRLHCARGPREVKAIVGKTGGCVEVLMDEVDSAPVRKRLWLKPEGDRGVLSTVSDF